MEINVYTRNIPMGEIMQSPSLAIDTETNGLLWWMHKPFLLGISNGDKVWVLKLHEMQPDLIREVLGKLYGARVLIGHNIKFDMHMLTRYRPIPDSLCVWDTQVAAHLLNENVDNDLETCVHRELGVDMVDKVAPDLWFKQHKVKKRDQDYSTLPEDITIKRVAWDAYHTYLLARKLQPLIHDHFSGPFALEMDVLKVLYKMEQNGAKIDTEYLSNLSSKLQVDIERAEKKLAKIKPINVNSSQQLGAYLYQELGHKVIKYSPKTGRPSTDYTTLSQLVKSEFVTLLLEYKDLSKLKSTYVDNLLRLSHNGYVHGQYNQTSTVSDRLSSSNPNLQNQPNDPRLKKAFITEPGTEMIFGDLSQIEMKLLAWYSQDPELLRVVSEQDVYKATAREVLGRECTPYERQCFKAIDLSIGFMCGNRGVIEFARSAGIEAKEEDLKLFREQFLEKFCVLKSWQEEVLQTAKVNRHPWGHHVRNPFGYIQRLENLYGMNKKGKVVCLAYQLVNRLVQSMAAAIMKTILVRIDKAMSPVWRGTIHDSLRIDIPCNVPDTRRREFIRDVKHHMTTWPEYNVPITAKFESSTTNWSELKEVVV